MGRIFNGEPLFPAPEELCDERRPGGPMTIRLHRGDLPDLTRYPGAVAIDTETMGLDPRRDRLCVVQLSPGDGSADVVQIPPGARDAPNLKALLGDPQAPEDLPLRPLRPRDAVQGLRRDAGAGLLHQDRVAADPHLHRQARAQGPGPRAARHRPVQAAAVVRLGRRRADRRRRSPTRPPTCCTCMPSRRSSTSCWRARAATELAAACFRFLPDRGPARPRRLGRRGHFRPFLRAPAPAGCRRAAAILPG